MPNCDAASIVSGPISVRFRQVLLDVRMVTAFYGKLSVCAGLAFDQLGHIFARNIVKSDLVVRLAGIAKH